MQATVVSTAPHLVVELPATTHDGLVAGRFFLARAEAGDEATRAWDHYLRALLYPIQIERGETAMRVSLAPAQPYAPAAQWLRARLPGYTMDLLGPLGNGFRLHAPSRTLLLVGDALRVPLLLPLTTGMLDRAGRVSILVRAEADDDLTPILDLLPLAVEMQRVEPRRFVAAVGDTCGWADQVALCAGDVDVASLAHEIRRRRYRLEDGYAQALVITPMPCGCGACLACLVSLGRGGFTRACVHGPVFDLNRLTV